MSDEKRQVHPAQLALPEDLAPAAELSSDFSLLKRLFPFARPYSGLFLIGILCVPFTAASAALVPRVKQWAVDAAIVDGDRDMFRTMVACFAAIFLLDSIVRMAQQFCLQLAGQKSLADLRREVFKKIEALPTSYLDRTPVGRIVTRLTNDVDAIGEVFSSGAILAIADLFYLAAIVAAMFWLDWQLTLVAFGALPFLFSIVAVFRRFARDAFRTIRAQVSRLNAYLAEQVEGVGVIQAFGREQECQAEYREINDAYRSANYLSIRYDALLTSVFASITNTAIAAVLWYMGMRAGWLDTESSAIWVGVSVAFYGYLDRFFMPLRELSGRYTIIQSSLAGVERVFQVLDYEEEDAPDGLSAPDARSDEEDIQIRFDEVTFGYREDQTVLQDIDFHVRRGETVALVGATGAGKTTVTSLLLRLYDIERGSIRIAGTDIRALEREDLRSRIAVVSQDVVLFAGSILDNVAASGGEPDRERAERVLRQVGAWAMVESREGGLDATISERGSNLSAGERQLISFARALYADREVLILDEATAQVDSETEAQLQGAVREVLRDRSAIVIAHRLSTIREADRILVFHRGRIEERGTHEELLEAGGIYARLHRLQFLSVPPPAWSAP